MFCERRLKLWLQEAAFWQVKWFPTSSFSNQRSAFDISLNVVFRLPAAAGISLILPPQFHSPVPISSRSRLVESTRKGIQVVAQRVTLVQQVVYPSKNL